MKNIAGILIILIIILSGCSKDAFIDETKNSSSTHFLNDEAAPFIDPSNTKVLIVGVLTWMDEENLPAFDDYHRKDMELMETLLNYGIPTDNIIGLFDENATRENIYKALHHIAITSDPETNFIFYFAGHGFNGLFDDASSIYFANYDIKYYHADKTGFNINFINDHFRPEFPGNSVILLADCCKSGGLVDIAAQFGAEGKKAVALTSCYYSEWSTGNWTFTQKIIDALNGDGLMDADNSGSVSLGEMSTGVYNGLKFVDRQKSFTGLYNCFPEAIVADVNLDYADFTDPDFHLGEYVFANFKHTWITVQISGKTGTDFQARYYNYADYETLNFEASELKTPYFVQYEIGDHVALDNFKPKPGIIIGGEDDFYEIINPEGGQILWRLYEKYISPDEIPAAILNADGSWSTGQILDQNADQYFVTFDSKGYQWDKWVDADHVNF